VGRQARDLSHGSEEAPRRSDDCAGLPLPGHPTTWAHLRGFPLGRIRVGGRDTSPSLSPPKLTDRRIVVFACRPSILPCQKRVPFAPAREIGRAKRPADLCQLEPVRGRKTPYGAAPESNRPSVGLPRRTGFEDRLGHRAHAAPPASVIAGTVPPGTVPPGTVPITRPKAVRFGRTVPVRGQSLRQRRDAERRSTRWSPTRRVRPSASKRSSSSCAVRREMPSASRKPASVIGSSVCSASRPRS
jgi:hypothetical protein